MRLWFFIWLSCLLCLVVSCTTPANVLPPPPVIPVPTQPPTAVTAVGAGPTPTREIEPTVQPTTLPSPTAPSFTPTTMPQWQNPPDQNLRQMAEAANATFNRLQPANTGLWQFDPGTFLHPISLEITENKAFLLDAGRVLFVDLASPRAPRQLLQPGDKVAELLVQEPVDLALIENKLLVLDRAGDVYALDLTTETWTLERFERPIGETSSHYFVALGQGRTGTAWRLRLESSYGYAQYYFPDGQERLWSLPDGALPVDISSVGNQIYVLWQNADGTAEAALFQDTLRLMTFALAIPSHRPRQIVATATAVYVLDLAGQRLLNFGPESGALQALYQLPQISSFAASPDGTTLFFAGRDRLYFWQQPEKNASIIGGETLTAPQPHNLAGWQPAVPYHWPISGDYTDLTPRDLQMPGAPRHYRLGIHQGIDFYWASGTPVYAVAPGTVIRATLDYDEPSELTFNLRRAENLDLGYTATENLDFYRGRQLWILQDDGLVARYAHLSAISPGIEEGTAVSAGQQIGLIGNSGSPASIQSESADAHLHFELWLGNGYLGQFLRPIETREFLELLFTP